MIASCAVSGRNPCNGRNSGKESPLHIACSFLIPIKGYRVGLCKLRHILVPNPPNPLIDMERVTAQLVITGTLYLKGGRFLIVVYAVGYLVGGEYAILHIE